MAKKTKTQNLLKNAFINKDKDFYKDVTINIDGEDVWLAKIKHITDMEQAGIIFNVSRSTNMDTLNEADVDKIELLYCKVKESLVDWAFDEEINIENIKYLAQDYFKPILDAIVELDEVWFKKSKK